MTSTDHIQSLRDLASSRRREAEFSGPRDRAELVRLAMRDERLANQLEHETTREFQRCVVVPANVERCMWEG